MADFTLDSPGSVRNPWTPHDECLWERDLTLTTITGYHTSCVRPAGATRIVSGNLGGYRFCPYCGKSLQFITITTGQKLPT